MRSFIAVGLLGLASLVGCTEQGTDHSALGASDQTVKGADSGTYLSVTSALIGPTCTGPNLAEVTLDGVLKSTASSAWADVSATIDGVTTSIDEIQPTEYSKDGRTKTFAYSYSFELADGDHSVQICFTQPSGKTRMTACTQAYTFTTSCPAETASSCADHPFGETVAQGNKNICSGSAAPHVNVNAKGDFGEQAQLLITGPAGSNYSKPATVDRAGNSCVYHYNWGNQFDNGGTGLYTFTLTSGAGGTSEPLTWTAELFCNIK
jgi:hypothetical protein